MSDDTEPNLKSRIQELISKTDPIIDKLLLKVVASGWSPVFVLGYTIVCVVIGVWVRGAA